MITKIQNWIGSQIINHLAWMVAGAVVLCAATVWSGWTFVRLWW